MSDAVVRELAGRVEALEGAVNLLLERVLGEEFVGKLDRLSSYEEERQVQGR